MDWIRLTKSGKDLSGTGGRILEITPKELSKHKTRKDAWMAINGESGEYFPPRNSRKKMYEKSTPCRLPNTEQGCQIFLVYTIPKPEKNLPNEHKYPKCL
jgi:hypothetical protein